MVTTFGKYLGGTTLYISVPDAVTGEDADGNPILSAINYIADCWFDYSKPPPKELIITQPQVQGCQYISGFVNKVIRDDTPSVILDPVLPEGKHYGIPGKVQRTQDKYSNGKYWLTPQIVDQSTLKYTKWRHMGEPVWGWYQMQDHKY